MIYEGKLQLLCRISVFHDKLSKCLSHSVTSTILCHLVKMVVRQVILVFNLCRICSQPLTRSDSLSCE